MTPGPDLAPVLRGHVQARLGSFTLDTGDFAWPLQGVTALFGPSGCGKSTLLRAIAGLLPQARGQLQAFGSPWLQGRRQLAPQHRDIGYVFQHAALFPHLDVQGNLEFARRRVPADRRAGAPEFAQQVQAAGIGHLLRRRVGDLSGGERQRVAIVRALLAQPRLLLLDEPLAALDWRARDALLDWIDTLARERRLPMVMVSHAPEEVERLADRVVLMHDGRVQGVEDLQQALLRADSVLFDRLGPVAVLQGQASPAGPGLARIAIGAWSLTVPAGSGAQTRVRVYARDVALAHAVPAGISMLNHLPATVRELAPSRAGHVLARLELDDGQGLWSEITAPACSALDLRPGQRIVALIKTASVQR